VRSGTFNPFKLTKNKEMIRAWFFFVSVIPFALVVPLYVQGESPSEDGWRRTTRGWEYAHAVQIVPPSMRGDEAKSTVFSKDSSSVSSRGILGSSTSKSPWFGWHVYALPLAAGTFFVSFGWWLLVDIPNRGIVRRLS